MLQIAVCYIVKLHSARQKVSLLLPHFVNKKLQLIVIKRSHHTSNDSVSFHYLAKYDVKKKHPVPIQVRWF